MPIRIPVSPQFSSIFSKVPIESGLPDEQIVIKISPHIHHKTFSRLRLNTPQSVTADQLLMIARLTQSESIADSADVIGVVRNPERYQQHPLFALILARVFSLSKKDEAELLKITHSYASTSGHIYLFDRRDSLKYLCPVSEHQEESLPDLAFDPTCSQWLEHSSEPHYDRAPRVFVVLTRASVESRATSTGDAAVEQLIGNIECGEHSLTIVNDALRLQHRVFRGIFADAEAVTIFDHKAMLVFPTRRKTFRLYESATGKSEARLIRETIGNFRHMRKFRTHPPSAVGVVSMLRLRLSYRLPGW
jgi:hypothetical protein